MRAFYGTTLANGLMLGTAQYPSPAILSDAFRRSGASVATVSIAAVSTSAALSAAVSAAAWVVSESVCEQAAALRATATATAMDFLEFIRG